MNNFFDTLLINEELLKAYSPISEDTEISDIVPFVSVAQSLHILPILGNDLFQSLQVSIKENNLTKEQSALILEIAKPLSFWTVYECLPFHFMKIVDKGITEAHSENSVTPSYKDISALRQNVQNTAEGLDLGLIKFLCCNKDTYTSWSPSDSSCCEELLEKNDEGSASKTFDSGIYFKDKVSNCKNNCGCGKTTIIP
jgi:hypothetical protein